MHAEVNFTVMSKALNYNRPHELTENSILSNNDRLTCCLNTVIRDLYLYRHLEDGELIFSAVFHTTVPHMLSDLNEQPFLQSNI